MTNFKSKNFKYSLNLGILQLIFVCSTQNKARNLVHGANLSYEK